MRDYAVIWNDDGALPRAGRLVVREDALELHGGRETDSPMVVPASSISEARAAHPKGERINGCPTIVLERRHETEIRIGTLGLGIVGEILGLVAALSERASDQRAVVILPLRKAGAVRARELIEAGPPFDPAAVGLTRHDVFIAEREAIFVLEGPRIGEIVEQLLTDVSVWRRAAAWRSCLDGRPRLAEHAYGWALDPPTPPDGAG